MYDLSKDPIINGINNGIKRGITVAIEGRAYASAAILVYSGIDSMAFLDMPEIKMNVEKNDFIAWADRYIKFPCVEQLSGADLYGARCAMLHNFSIYSRMSQSGECRIVGYMDKSVPEVQYNPEVSKELVLVSVTALAEAFSSGVDRFLIEAFSEHKRREVLESRLARLVQCMPVGCEETNVDTAT